MTKIDGLMDQVVRLGNDQLVAQARYSLEANGVFVTPKECVIAFMAAAHILDLAERSFDANVLSAGEMVACQSVASLAMQIWVTLHDMLDGQDIS